MPLDKKTLISAAALAAAAGAGFGLAKLSDRSPAANSPHAEAHAEPRAEEGVVRLSPAQAQAAGIAVVSLGQGGAGALRLTGRVEAAPNAHAMVAAPVAGAVTQVLAQAGTRVSAGAGLAVIRSADGAMVRAEAVAASADAEAARAVLAREERLLKAGVVARQDWEAARAAAAGAAARAEAARAKARALGSPGASGEIVVRSPIAGVVSAMNLQPGGFVAQGAPVADVADPGRVEVVFTVPAEAAAAVRLGAGLTIARGDGGETSATVTGVAPMAQDATGAAVVRARPAGPGLTPGAAVSAVLAARGQGGGLTAPAEAVQTVEGRTVVFVAEPGGFRARPITVGRAAGGQVPIVQGLRGDEKIAGRGAFVLKAELAKGEAEHSH